MQFVQKWVMWIKRSRSFDLGQITLQEVRADEIALEREQMRLEEGIEHDQERVRKITEEAVSSGSKTKAKSATRRILQIQETIRDAERSLAVIGKQLTGLSRIKRLISSQARLVTTPLLERLNQLSPAELERALTKQMSVEEMREKGILDVVEILDGPATAVDEIEESPEAKELFATIVAAQEARDPSLVTSLVAERMEAVEEI
jgi:hypothetical protein